MRRALLIALLVLVSVGTGSAQASKPKLHVVITAQSHHPKLHHTWSYEVHVTAKGKPVVCKIHVQMWLMGSSVGEIGTHVVKNGVWKETIVAKGPNAFPLPSVGQPLTLHATATAKGFAAGAAGWSISVVK